MNYKIVALVAILVAIYVGFPKYKQNQRENNVREFLKRPFVGAVKEEASGAAHLRGFQMDILNHYPDFRIYQTFPFSKSEAPNLIQNVDLILRQQMCKTINQISNSDMPQNDIEALFTVFKEDKVTFHLIVKDKYGVEMFKTSQMVDDCKNLGAPPSDLPANIWKSKESLIAPAAGASHVEAAAAVAH